MNIMFFFFLLVILTPPTSTLFPYTTLFRSITNNLRQLSAAAQQYMLENGVSQVNYTDVVDRKRPRLNTSQVTMAGDDFSSHTIHNTDTQISVTSTVITVTDNL